MKNKISLGFSGTKQQFFTKSRITVVRKNFKNFNWLQLFFLKALHSIGSKFQQD